MREKHYLYKFDFCVLYLVSMFCVFGCRTLNFSFDDDDDYDDDDDE